MSQFVDTFGINWFELLAFVVNFLIVLWVLKKYLYTPILVVLQKRQQEVLDQAKITSDLSIQKQQLSAEIDNNLKIAQDRADEIIKSAKDIADAVRKKTLADTKQQIEIMQNNMQKQLEHDKLQIYQELKQDLTALVVKVSSKVIDQQLDPKDHQDLIQKTIDSIEKGNE